MDKNIISEKRAMKAERLKLALWARLWTVCPAPLWATMLRQHARNRTDRLGTDGRVPWQADLASPLSRGGATGGPRTVPCERHTRTADME